MVVQLENVPDYRAIDMLFARLCDSSSIPQGTLKALYTAIDNLRSAGAPGESIRIVENVSAAVHKWEWSLRLGDRDRQAAVKDHVGALAKRWAHVRSPGDGGDEAPPMPEFRVRSAPAATISNPPQSKRRRRRSAKALARA